MQRAISNPEVGMPVLVSEGSIFEPKYALWTVSKAGEEEIVLSREGEKDLSITKTRLHDRGYGPKRYPMSRKTGSQPCFPCSRRVPTPTTYSS